MPFAVVLLPNRRTHDRLAALAAAIGGAERISLLGAHPPAHVSVVHFAGHAGQGGRDESADGAASPPNRAGPLVGLRIATVDHHPVVASEAVGGKQPTYLGEAPISKLLVELARPSAQQGEALQLPSC